MTCSLKTKNENLELGTCGINDPWFYREVRCCHATVLGSFSIAVLSQRDVEVMILSQSADWFYLLNSLRRQTGRKFCRDI